MEEMQNPVVYAVNSDLDDGILYAEFKTEEEALKYAKEHLDKLPYIDKMEVVLDLDGDIEDVLSYTTIWDHTMADQAAEETEDDYWEMMAAAYEEEQANKHDLGDTTWFESMDNLVETLEENEDTVECKECFELFPKVDCVKLVAGYVCPTCAECGTVSEDDIFKMDFPEYDKMSVGNDMVPEEPTIEASAEVTPEEVIENDPISTPEEAVPFLVKDEEEAVAGYEKAAEVVEASDLENKEEILDTIDHIKEEEEEHIEELSDLVTTEETTAEDDEIIEVVDDPVSEEPVTESGELKTWTCWYEGSDIGTVEAATEEEAKEAMMSKYPEYQYNNTDWGVDLQEELVEHVNQESPAVESDQELEGTDNAVVDCKVADVVTHSEDEKPLQEKFTPEEMAEYNMDEDGNSLDGYDTYVRCTWCEDIFSTSECDFEADMGWLCDRCQSAITSRGERLTIITNPTEEDIARVLGEGVELDESAILAGVATGVIVDVVKRIMDKAGDHKKKSKWIDFRKYVIEKTPEGQINIWNHDSEQVASDLKTIAAAKEKIKELNQKAKEDKKAAKKNKNKPTETPEELTELFGKKKPMARYIIGFSGMAEIPINKLIQAVRKILAENGATNFKEYDLFKKRHFAVPMDASYEFVCTEKAASAIRADINKINLRTLVKPGTKVPECKITDLVHMVFDKSVN